MKREYIHSEDYPGHYWLIESEERLVVAYDPPPFRSPTTVHVIEYSAYESLEREVKALRDQIDNCTHSKDKYWLDVANAIASEREAAE